MEKILQGLVTGDQLLTWLEEREILMQAMLGVLGGLQELGANGPTQEATDAIHKYINKQAHRREKEE